MKFNRGRWASTLLCAVVGLSACNESAETSKKETKNSGGDSQTQSAMDNAADQVDVSRFLFNDTVNALVESSPNSALLTTTTDPCLGGGSVTVTVDDVDPEGPSSGDTYTSTYTDCIMWGNRTMNGTNAFEIVTLTGDPTQPPPAIWAIETTAATDMTVTSTQSTRVTLGTFSFAAGTTDGVTYTRAAKGDSEQTVTVGAAPPRTETRNVDTALSWDVGAATYVDTVTINSTGGHGGDLAVETLEPLSGSTNAGTGTWTNSFGPPTAGVLVVTRTNATATSIRTYTAQSDGTVQVETDANGDGTPESTTVTRWPFQILALLGLLY